MILPWLEEGPIGRLPEVVPLFAMVVLEGTDVLTPSVVGVAAAVLVLMGSGVEGPGVAPEGGEETGVGSGVEGLDKEKVGQDWA
jgi:hypothetical protein